MGRATLHAAVAATSIVAVATKGLAQMEPPDSCFPTDTHPCCWATYTTATVTSGAAYISDPGVTQVWRTPELVCDNCPQPRCCECDPPPLVRVCVAGLGITLEISATASLHAGLTVPAAQAVEASLGAALGVTVGTSVTLNVECPIPTPGCQILGGAAEVTTVRGKTAAVDHQWSIAGVWVSHPGYLCGPGTCPIEGAPWTSVCPTQSSTAVAKIESFECLALTSYECRMICSH